MLTDHINKCRTAGCGFLLTCVICFQPLLSLALCSHISTETNLDHVCKTNLLQCDLPALHGNVRTKLSLCRRGYHTIDFLARFQCTDHIQNKCLGTDRTKWTFVDTVTTADTLALINYGNTKIIVCNGIYRTCKLTWTLQMSDSIVRACLGTHTALFTFIGINVGTLLSGTDSTELTCIHTCLTQTILTVVRYNITGNRTVLTCGRNNLYNISIVLRTRSFSLCQTNTLTDNLTFFIDAATELRCWSRYHLTWQVISFLLQSALKGQLCHLIKYIMLDPNHIFICKHFFSPYLVSCL